MSQILFKDISQYQGDYNMGANSDPAIAIKMGGGDAGLYMDSKANANYENAVKAGKVPIGYWFAGGGDPVAEADYFLRCMAPLAEDDVYALDWEIQHTDPVAWVLAFVNHIHDKIGVWPLVYMNMSTANAYDWSPVFNNCGYWCAAPSYSFDATLPVKYPQAAQQGPIVNGVDTDAFFGTVDDLKKYGYHVQTPQPTPAPSPTPEPAPQPTPVPQPEPTPQPSPTPEPPPVPVPEPTPPPVVVVTTPKPGIKKELLAIIVTISAAIGAFLAWLHS